MPPVRKTRMCLPSALRILLHVVQLQQLFLLAATAPIPPQSAVSMRSLSYRAAPDTHATFPAAVAFNVTRIDWVYTDDPMFFAAARTAGLSTTAAINSVLPDTDSNPSTYTVGRELDLNGKPIQLPWMTWGAKQGCINTPAYRQIVQHYASKLQSVGATGLQHDDAAANYEGFEHGGCFCSFCMAGFTKALVGGAVSPAQRQAYNISGPDWDYGTALRAGTVPAAAATPLHDLFGVFQQNSTRAYVQWLRQLLDAGAGGARVPISANNGGSWGTPFDLFDFGLGELTVSARCNAFARAGDPAAGLGGPCLAAIATQAIAAGRPQMMTMPKYDPPLALNETFVRAATRATIAQGYALGVNVLVPWDIYMPGSVYNVTGTGVAGDGRRLVLPSDNRGVNGTEYTGCTSALACQAHCSSDTYCAGCFFTADTATCITVNVTVYLASTSLTGVSYARSGAPRYFGTPEAYGDLYGLVRAVPSLFDNHTNVTALDKPQVRLPARVTGAAADTTYVTLRAAGANSSTVVHMVDWAGISHHVIRGSRSNTTLSLACAFFSCSLLARNGITVGFPALASPERGGSWSDLRADHVTDREAVFTLPQHPDPWAIAVVPSP